jgi:polyisoprenyl-phosphate glycosyltransferase
VKANILISIVTPCFNEEENVDAVYAEVKKIFESLNGYTYEHIFIDNASTDRTVDKLRTIASQDPNIKIIVNARNFGTVRSPYYGLLQTRGDAAMTLAADLQDPPELIKEFIHRWEEGFKIVAAVKSGSNESPLMFLIRKNYYRLISRLSEVDLLKDFNGFGLFDREVIEILRQINDPYPYLRGLVADIGFPMARVDYMQPARRRGITKNNFYTLYDQAMLGITNHSKVPLRLAAMLGFAMAFLSFLAAVGYFVYKLVFWNNFTVGVAPIIIGLFFFASVQLFFLGIIGEYIGSIHTQILKRPLVIERERINFDGPAASEENQPHQAQHINR